MLRYRLFIFGRSLLEFSVSASEKLLYLLLFVFEPRCSGTSFVDGVSIVVECRLIDIFRYIYLIFGETFLCLFFPPFQIRVEQLLLLRFQHI